MRLIENGTSAKARDELGRTLMHLASRNGKIENNSDANCKIHQ